MFDLSYHYLPEDLQLLFRRLGLLPGHEIDAHAAAARLGAPVDATGHLLVRLADHSLIAGASPGRYRAHDLVRAHARTRAINLDPAPEREMAFNRLLHYYADAARIASHTIARYPRPVPDAPAGEHVRALEDPGIARNWLRTEHPTLDAAWAHARLHRLEAHTIALAAGMAEILIADGPWIHALAIHQAATDAAPRCGRPVAEALNDLGRMRHLTSDHRGAKDALTRSLEIYQELGNRLGEANALNHSGRALSMTGNHSGAGEEFARALDIYREIGNRLGEANALTDLGRAR